MPVLMPVVEDHDIGWVTRWATRTCDVATLWAAPREDHLLPAAIQLTDAETRTYFYEWSEDSSISLRRRIAEQLDRLLPRWVPKAVFDATLSDAPTKHRRGRVA
jgi:hypothetical protein